MVMEGMMFSGHSVGIKQFDYLKVYNRWGQMVFYTVDYRNGWDGILAGTKTTGRCLWKMAHGIDYSGNTIEKKRNGDAD